jgi:Transcriptional regulators
MPVPQELIQDFLGSSQVLASAVRESVEKKLLLELTGSPVTVSQLRLLKMIALTGARTIRDVAQFIGVSNAAASKAVDKLVRRKLLRRAEGLDDRREIRLSLTEAAKNLLAEYDDFEEKKLSSVFAEFEADDVRRTIELLDRISAALIGRESDAGEICVQCGIYYREKCLVRQLVQRNCFYHDRRERKAPPR